MAGYPESELTLYADVQINGNNNGSVGPSQQHERWLVTHISTSSNSSAAKTPTVIHYRNYVHPSMMLEGTYSGNLDNDTTANFAIGPGEKIVTSVTGGDTTATTWVRFEGKRWIPYRGYQ